MMTASLLRQSILELAMQGKLVEQASNEGTGQKLIETIEKTNQFKKRDTSAIANVEKEYDIPSSWEWVQLDNIATLYNGRAYKQKELLDTGKTPVLRVGNLFTSDKWYYSDLELESSKYCDSEDLIYSWSASFGPFIWKGGKVIFHYHIWKIEYAKNLFRDYLYYFLMTETQRIKSSGHGLAMIHVTKAGMEKLLVPLPPLAEQKRIVAKIEELMPFVEQYEAASTKLNTLNASFPEMMKKSILQEAVQGKLVPQDPNDEPASLLLKKIAEEKKRLTKEGKIKKQKPLPEITEDEIPFDIPESWEWVRFENAVDMLSGFAFKSSDFVQDGEYRLLRGINLGVGEVRWDDTVYVNNIPDKLSIYQLKKGDVLLGLDRPWISNGIRVAVFNGLENTYLVQRVLRIREIGVLSCEYVALILRSSLLSAAVQGQTTGISVPHISPKQVGSIAVPVPPVEEQKRIVEKVKLLCTEIDSFRQ